MSDVVSIAQNALSHAQKGALPAAWEALGPVLGQLGTERALALAFAQVLAQDPTYPDVLPRAEHVVAGFGGDAEVVIALAAALVRVAERRPADEPPFEQGPAHLAAAVCQSCFEGLASAERTAPEVGGYLQINLADALRMMGPDRDEEALKAYRLALTIDDSRGAWWFQLGLLHKWRGRFQEGLEANQKALARGAAERPTCWNLAICATALGKGALAVEAWQKLGIPAQLAPSGMPLVPDMPPMLVRVATLGEDVGQSDPLPPGVVTFEVLWVQPLSPCHGVVQSPTARKASVDYGDLVLWDGAPVRMNAVDDRAVPVFALLSLLKQGDERRLRFVGMQKTAELIDAIAKELGDDVSLVVFDRRSSDEGELFYGKLIVPGSQDLKGVEQALARAVRSRPGITLAIPALYEQLGDTPSAGKAHQAWAGIERQARKHGQLPGR
jgi:tetratricopeptide (TPR) repeat protein